MKIGILTFHRADNCGAVLQCYALQETLRRLGHDVGVVDYRQPHIEKFYRIWKGSKNLAKFVVTLAAPLRRRLNFRKFRKERMRIWPVDGSGRFPSCDAYIIGSDQVWSDECTAGFDPVYFGYFKRAGNPKVVGYSVSTPVGFIDRYGTERMRDSLANFSSLSFRERNLAEYVAEKVGFEGKVTLDPTLLHPREFWEPVAESGRKRSLLKYGKRKYLLIHLYNYRLNEEDLNMIHVKAEEMARDKGCRILDISKYISGPEQFLSLIRDAEFVITNSFHAVAFSLLFGKQFCVVKSDDVLDGRYVELLKSIGAGSALALPSAIHEDLSLDYEVINANLERLRSESIDYLVSSLNLNTCNE